MKEQDFIPERPKRRERLLLVPAKLRGAAAAGASAAGLAVLAFVLAVLPPVTGASVVAATAGGISVASRLA